MARSLYAETPVIGAGAVARWLALHDRARDLRKAIRSGDSVAERQVRRAIRSLFLYEHQLAPQARRQARMALWRRDCSGVGIPQTEAQLQWGACHCHRCHALRTVQLVMLVSASAPVAPVAA